MGSQAAANLKGSTRLGNYLRKLRSGYGYSLRRVEERARAEGGEIDNSQLSRYEKGICYPSFDKLRVLASVFNVSIQSFSDVVDLDVYEELKPESTDPVELVETGDRAVKDGDHGAAFACYERAIELLLDRRGDLEARKLLGEVRVTQAAALTRLGKLALAEQELRAALRAHTRLDAATQIRALLSLANIHADLGDTILSEIEAEKASRLANQSRLERYEAMAKHTLARVLADQGEFVPAVDRYREAAQLYGACGETFEAVKVRMGIGTCYVDLGKTREGVRMLRSALSEAKAAGHRRLQAYAWSNLSQAYYRQNDVDRARACLRESDALALYNNEKQTDILFLNAYYEWKMAGDADNPTRERIAFGRLKALRSELERKFPEVEAFDRYMERGHRHA